MRYVCQVVPAPLLCLFFHQHHAVFSSLPPQADDSVAAHTHIRSHWPCSGRPSKAAETQEGAEAATPLRRTKRASARRPPKKRAYFTLRATQVGKGALRKSTIGPVNMLLLPQAGRQAGSLEFSGVERRQLDEELREGGPVVDLKLPAAVHHLRTRDLAQRAHALSEYNGKKQAQKRRGGAFESEAGNGAQYRLVGRTL